MADEAVKVEAVQPEVAAPVEAVAEATPANETTVTKTEEAPAAEVSETAVKTEEAPAAEASETIKTEEAPETEASATSDVKTEEQKDEAPKAGDAKKDAPKPKAKKYDPSVLPPSDDPVLIRRQVEFYFGDSNLPKDKFMWEQTGGGENRPLKLKTLCNFARMRRFQPHEAVVKALKESTFLNVSGPEGDEEITRKTAYVPNNKPYGLREAATVYMKGFGEEEPDTQFKIEAMILSHGQVVKEVRLRRTDDSVFKGSVFVEFEDEDQAKAFMALDPKPQFEGRELKIMSKKAYVEEKNQLIKEGKMEPSKSRKARYWEGRDIGGDRDKSGGRGRGRGRGNSGGSRAADPNDWKKRREEDQQNGFQRNDRNDRNSRGRGRGRGGRGRGGRDRGGRDRDNNRRDNREERPSRSTNDIKRPTIKSSAGNGDAAKGGDDARTNGKRSRDAGGEAGEERPAKKADTKTEATAEA